ncbi:cellulose biosynthesis cyclic di-GMP-binding regulatory protein BcsB [Caproicibacter sp. BJN0012]|uniref:cellulose biosynthesis cyclic di-GMP-binding regulatory protein BcsB n=1 Tax=Caproicibacter sp. BJN0012 TaxID=3110227 RepID=UPI002E0FA9BF|nr:cellulose biosynthesis cyclic di-GMP-binding regulatory protein BcsB [Caproicibacter sp. BJN0012]
MFSVLAAGPAQDVFAASQEPLKSASSMSEADRQAAAQKQEQERLTTAADAAKRKADQLVAEGKLNRLNSDYVDVQLFAQTVHLSMPKNTASFWFSIPKGTSLKDGCSLNLDVTISTTLIDNRSSISLAVNGTTLETKWIYDVVKNQTAWWKVNVPVSLLKTDGSANDLTITTTQRSIEGDCADIDNPSNWVRFDPDSYLHLAVGSYAEPSLGNLYSYFYDNLDDSNGIQNEFILPRSPDAAVISKMLKVSSAIGANSRWKNLLNFKVSELSPSDSSIRNKIYLGLVQNWTGNGNLTLPGALAEEEGFLSVKGNSALITGRSETGLQKAADFFSGSAYLNRIDAKSLVVKSEIPNSSVQLKPNDTGYYTLKDFGYSDINLAGAFHQSTTLTLTQPSGVKSGTASYVNVKFRHSKALSTDASLLTVYLNDVAYGSARLNSSNADGGSIKIKIPDDVLQQEAISLKIDVYNYLGKIDCSKDWYDTAWTVIDKASEVYFEPGNNGVAPTLANFPTFSMFTTDDATGIMMIAPGYSNTEMLSLMSLLSGKAGQNSGNVFNFSVSDSFDKLTDQDRKKNMILVGSYDQLKLPQEVSSALGVAPEGGDTFRISKDLPITPETLQNKTLIQVIRSPWNFYKKIYVVTYDKSMQKNLIAFLSDKTLSGQLSDEISVVNADGEVTSYPLGADTGVSSGVPLSWERAKYLVEKWTGIPLWAMAVILLLVVICLILLIRLSRNKKRFQKNAEKMRKSIEKDSSAEDVSAPPADRLPDLPDAPAEEQEKGKKGPNHFR